MTKLYCFGSLLLILGSGLALAQENPGGYTVSHPNEEIRIPQLHPLMARSHDPGDVLLTSLDIAFNDPSLCCGKNSALEDRALAADPLSLKQIAAKIQGRWLLSDGRPIEITADFLSPAPSVDISRQIVGALKDKHAMLMVWGSHLYVLYGVVFDEVWFSDSDSFAYMIHKLLLLDARYSDSRREAVFNRDTDDLSKVQGFLFVGAKPQ